MSQHDILKIINETKKGITTRQIAKILKIQQGCVARACGQLRKWGEVRYKYNNRKLGGNYYIYYSKKI